ncbi:MAG: hypothetical protein Athens101410_781 [Parcubacteria group bacterium Athens1014_10]|nr:MAG: hypothetical protein Athens101410_781 [Parcubacteria group bacterium Athens1014_10]
MKIREKIQYLKERPFVKDAAVLQIGNIFSTLLSLAASVTYARVLGADNYGLYALVFALVNLLSIIDFGGFYSTLTLLAEAYHQKDKAKIKNILTYFVKISLMMFFTIGILTIIIAPLIAEFIYKNPQIGNLAQLIIMTGLLKIMFNVLIILLQVLRKVKQLTIIENLNKIIYIIIPVSLVLLGYGLKGIFIGHLITAAIFLPVSYIVYELIAKKEELLPSMKEIFLNLKKVKIAYYVKFGVLIGINQRLGAYYSAIPLLLAGIFISAADIANFKIAFSYITLSGVILAPVARILSVQLPKSKVYGDKILKRDFLKASFLSFCISVAITAGLLVAAPFLIKFFYGKEFINSIRYACYLAPYAILSGLDVGMGAIFRTTKKMKAIIKIHLTIILLTLPIIYFAIKHYLIKGLIFVTIFLLILQVIFSFLYLNRFFKSKEKIVEKI